MMDGETTDPQTTNGDGDESVSHGLALSICRTTILSAIHELEHRLGDQYCVTVKPEGQSRYKGGKVFKEWDVKIEIRRNYPS